MAAADPAAAAVRGAAALGTELPVVQAGMGGIAGPALAAAVSEAGALGTVALYKSDRELAAALVEQTAARTTRGFGVNVIPEVADRLLDQQLAAVLDRADRRLTVNSYGLPPRSFAAAVLAAGHRLLVQTGSHADARAAAELGAHAVAVQGVEAGGHHLGEQPLADLLTGHGLDVPVLASGAVATGADLLRVLTAGASGAICGTLFVAAAESAAHPDYKCDLAAAGPGDTVVTDRFAIGWPGRSHRVLRSAVTDAPAPLPSAMIAWTTVMGARRPVPRGSAAAPTAEAEGRVGEMARYAGLGCAAVTAVEPAATLLGRLREQYARALAGR
ncbi:nitronate monooxygenase family protein [Streptomyces sp. TLI_171]|uniref:NAD(P)H-dependent flavin oxidoreductase n=1 Tax=Streptomyces sp. TLI_171 TaxID=1938859 RepID=UPI000C19865B|nr:nitronate monooxygenase [Streptomyces sp. TLI_171]RKE17796.1 nitronate monooxygenase [Streptomyces sp. TLI_171]